MGTDSIAEALMVMCNAGLEVTISQCGGNARAVVKGPGLMLYRDHPVVEDAVLRLYGALCACGEIGPGVSSRDDLTDP